MFSRQQAVRKARWAAAGITVLLAMGGAASAQSAPQSCSLPPNSTMVAWYPFDEVSGQASADIAGGNAGSQVNGPLGTSSGKVAGAASFDGSSQYIEFASSIVTNIGPADSTCNGIGEGAFSTCEGNFSIEVWLQITSAPTTQMTIVDKLNTHPVGYRFGVLHDPADGGDFPVLQLADGGAAPGFTVYSSLAVTLTDGNWHHLAVTVDRSDYSNDSIEFYLDGSAIFFTTCVGNCLNRPDSLSNDVPLRVGRSNNPSSGLAMWFKGKLDELSIYNRVLSAPEISAIYTAGTAGKCK